MIHIPILRPLTKELEGGFSGAVAVPGTAEQQSSSTARLHVSPPGVCNQHGLLQPVDRPAVGRWQMWPQLTKEKTL